MRGRGYGKREKKQEMGRETYLFIQKKSKVKQRFTKLFVRFYKIKIHDKYTTPYRNAKYCVLGFRELNYCILPLSFLTFKNKFSPGWHSSVD